MPYVSAPALIGKGDQPGDPEAENNDRYPGIRTESQETALTTDDDPHRVDRRQRNPERGDPAVQAAGARQHRRPGDQIRDQEEADLKRVATEDVPERERVVAEANGRDAGADLGQSRGRC